MAFVSQRSGIRAGAPQSTNPEAEITRDGQDLLIPVLVLHFESTGSESNRLCSQLFENAHSDRAHASFLAGCGKTPTSVGLTLPVRRVGRIRYSYHRRVGVICMRGRRQPQATMLAFVDLDERVPTTHPLRVIKPFAERALAELSPVFDQM